MDNKIRKIWSVLTLIAITTGSVEASEDIINLKANIHKTYQEWGDPKYRDYLREVYEQLPDYIRDYCKENLFHIVIMNNSDGVEKVYEWIYDQAFDSGYETFGITIPNLSASFIEGSDHSKFYNKYKHKIKNMSEEEYNKLIIKFTLIHEMGHLFDISKDYISETDELLNIFESDVSSFKKIEVFSKIFLRSDLYIGTPNEYFATIFASYFLYPEELKDYCPSSYNYIDNIIDELKHKKKAENTVKC